MPFSLSQRAHRRLYILTIFILLTLYTTYSHYSTLTTTHPIYSINSHIPPNCPPLPDLHNIVLVLKTGVTEAHDKLPIHRNTTLRCIPNYIVWSDYDESIADIPVHDVLYNESSNLHQLPDFNLYTKVKQNGRGALNDHDLSDDPSTPFGKSNPGWKLDKWKFIPMIEHTFNTFPSKDMKWFIFMEADTYILWPSMLSWLSRLDANKAYYLGNQMQIRDVLFAHGGSGFVLSRPAIQAATDLLEAKRDYWDSITMSEWAGDCVLGILLKEAGIELGWSWPMLQLAPVQEIEHFSANYGRTPWCYPAVSFHHLRPEDVRQLSSFEAEMAREKKGGIFDPVLWRDVFYHLARPNMSPDLVRNWDNQAQEEKRVTKSAEECKALCEDDQHCLQFVRRDDGMCLFGRDARVGAVRMGFESGWMVERIDKTARLLGECRVANWVTD
ncbi:hypothetical protein BDV19DRAFT_207954 [Aspergillus venezuelensis]